MDYLDTMRWPAACVACDGELSEFVFCVRLCVLR